MEKSLPINIFFNVFFSDVGRAASRIKISQRRVYGSMSGRQHVKNQESHDSLDSDSDLLIDGDLDDDEDDLLDSMVDDDINNLDLKVGQEKTVTSKVDHSDEDF